MLLPLTLQKKRKMRVCRKRVEEYIEISRALKGKKVLRIPPCFYIALILKHERLPRMNDPKGAPKVSVKQPTASLPE
jgi:hypothetical protein